MNQNRDCNKNNYELNTFELNDLNEAIIWDNRV